MAARVLAIKVPEELIEVLGITAEALDISRNALARQALESVVDAAAVEEARSRRAAAVIRANLGKERELIESGAVDYRALRTPTGGEDEGPAVTYTVLPGAPVVTARALIMLDVRIARLTGVINNATCEAVRVAAIDARGEARAQRVEILLTHALDRPYPD